MHKLKPHFNLVIAFLILSVSYFSCTTEPVETALLLPVNFSNVPENMVLSHFNTDKIEIKIKAVPKLIELINKEDIRYPVDLYTDLEFDPAGASSSIEPGEYLIPVEEKRIPVYPGIKIVSINPTYLSVQIEQKAEKTFKISVPYTGKPAKGYIALEPVIKPASVKLTGALSLIHYIKELKTKPVDLAGAKQDFKKKVPLDIDDLSITPSSDHIITVTVPIQQQLISKTVDNILIQAQNCKSSASIEPSRISIQIQGPFETLNNQKIMEQIYSFIDLQGLEPGVYARHAYINIPVDIMMTDAAPKVFTVKIK